MFNLGAFAGGLAQGIRSGQNMELRQKLAERAAKADEREAEIHRVRMDKAAFNKDTRDRLRAANDEITAGWRHNPHDEAARPAPGLSDLSAQTPAIVDTRAAGLSSLTKPTTRTTADEMIGRRMLTGNLLEDADALTRMANIYQKHGLLKEMAPWMNKAYEAKKKRIPDALHFLLTGDAKAAGEILKKGGINLVADPAPTDEDDPQNHGWKFRFEGGGEKEINLKELAAGFFPSSTLRSIDRVLP
ncbi:MAG: hypothetical protein L0H15_03845 [Nitrosospira sp.]|nr:hypothetical protein [Nitrosospira sp.]MDN5836650.1 hypothetical protein [Nitrosospira sp.]